MNSQRVGEVEGDSDGGVDETGSILVILVLLIEAIDFVGNGTIFILLSSLLESLDESDRVHSGEDSAKF